MSVEEAVKSLRKEVLQCVAECEACCADIEDGQCSCRNAVILSAVEKNN